MREIRLIVMEHVRGVPPSAWGETNVKERLSQVARKNTMYKMVENDMETCVLGIVHRDLLPQHIWIERPFPLSLNVDEITNAKLADPRLNLRVVDFGFVHLKVSAGNELCF